MHLCPKKEPHTLGKSALCGSSFLSQHYLNLYLQIKFCTVWIFYYPKLWIYWLNTYSNWYYVHTDNTGIFEDCNISGNLVIECPFHTKNCCIIYSRPYLTPNHTNSTFKVKLVEPSTSIVERTLMRRSAGGWGGAGR